jgi:hypothetical protein
MSNGATSLRCYVSYAWADDDNPEREAQVDALVEQARRKGVDVVRDKDVLKAGDRISDFMRRIGGSDRIFVFLSHKYLTSAFCMNKLFLIWRNSREDESDFLSRVRVYTLDDARFDRFEDRLSYAKYWRNEHDRLKEIIKGSLSEVSDFDYRRFRLMDQFATNIGDILALFSDTVRPRSFEDFLKYGFEDGSSAGRAVPRPPAYVPPLAAVAMGGIERPSAAESFVEAAQARWAQEEANRRKTVWRIVGALSIVAVAIALAVAVSRSTLRPSGWFSGTSTDKRPSYTSSIDVSSPASTDIAWCYQGRQLTGQYGAFCFPVKADCVSQRDRNPPPRSDCGLVNLSTAHWNPAEGGDAHFKFQIANAPLSGPFPQIDETANPGRSARTVPQAIPEILWS